jgi:hypothetical protein
VTIQHIRQRGYAGFEARHPLPAYVRTAVWALLACRTARLGGHIQACPAGHVERVWYNSCRHRRCPPGAWLQVARWLGRQQVRLRACDHDPVIFTMPDELRGLWLAHGRAMTNLLCATVHATLDARLGDAKDLGACPGLLAALHTWSQTWVWPPPLHCLVPGGGLTDAGPWHPVRHGVLLPARVVMAVLRGQRLAAVDAAVQRGTRTRPDGRLLRPWAIWRNTLGRQKWHVDLRERYAHGTGVLTSVARSLRGGPLANQRLVSGTPQAVTWRYRRNREPAGRPGAGRLTFSMAEVIRRDLRHVPDPGTKVVRCSGL